MERYIATESGISQDRIHAVIHNELHMSKVSAHCVPKLLRPDLKQTPFNMLRKNLVIFGGISQQFSSEICDLGPSLPTRDETTIEAVETPGFSAFQGSQDCGVRRQGDGLHFLGCRRSSNGGQSKQGSHYHLSLLCWSSETATGENQADSTWKANKRSDLPPGQCACVRSKFHSHRIFTPGWEFLNRNFTPPKRKYIPVIKQN